MTTGVTLVSGADGKTYRLDRSWHEFVLHGEKKLATALFGSHRCPAIFGQGNTGNTIGTTRAGPVQKSTPYAANAPAVVGFLCQNSCYLGLVLR